MFVDIASFEFCGVGDCQADFLRLELFNYLLEAHLLQIEDDVGHVFTHARHGGELMLHAIDLNGRDSKALERGEQNATQGITDSDSEAGLQGTELELSELVVVLQHQYFVRSLKC